MSYTRTELTLIGVEAAFQLRIITPIMYIDMIGLCQLYFASKQLRQVAIRWLNLFSLVFNFYYCLFNNTEKFIWFDKKKEVNSSNFMDIYSGLSRNWCAINKVYIGHKPQSVAAAAAAAASGMRCGTEYDDTTGLFTSRYNSIWNWLLHLCVRARSCVLLIHMNNFLSLLLYI